VLCQSNSYFCLVSTLSIEKFIADKISGGDKDKSNISKPIVKIAILGIVLGVAVMLLTISIVTGFKKEITNKITGLTTHIAIGNVILNPGTEPLPVNISADSLKLLKSNALIKNIQSTATKNGIIKTENENEGIVLKGIERDYDFTFLKNNLIEGRLPEFNDSTASKDILVSQTLADKLELKLNQKMQLYFIVQREVYDSVSKETFVKSENRSRKLEICGIFKSDFADFDNNLTFVDLTQIQKLNYWNENMVGNYEIRLHDFENLELAKTNIEDFLGYNYSVYTIKEIYANIFIWLDKLDINGVIVVVLMIMVAVINMITALLILILERTNMVGLVKALGMNNANVRKIFFYISLKLIGKGLLWGNVLGIGFCYLQYYFKIIKLDAATYYVDFVAVDINWLYIAALNVGTFVVCVLMLFLPSLIITKLTPIKTLRFD